MLAEGGATVVADPGANALLRVAANGDVSTIAAFRARPTSSTDAVTTSVARGLDGAYYAVELTGAPFAAGAARVYRVVPDAAPEIFLTGFKTIIDLDFGPDGSLYISNRGTSVLTGEVLHAVLAWLRPVKDSNASRRQDTRLAAAHQLG